MDNCNTNETNEIKVQARYLYNIHCFTVRKNCLLGRIVKINDLIFNIGIKHGFPCINVCHVPRVMLKTVAEGRGFQHLPRDLANVNALENNV